jgi:serine/threonine-protein kinase RsbW
LKTHKIYFDNSLENLSVLRSEIEAFIGSTIDNKTKNRIILCLDEAVSNIIEHGFPNGEQSKIELEMKQNELEIIFILEDSGIEFNPLERKQVDVDEHLELGQDGGMGIFIFQKIMSIEYAKRTGGGNRLTLKKNYLEINEE